MANAEERSKKRASGRPRGTRTSPFGAPGRISHDSSDFYAARMYQDLEGDHTAPYFENPVPDGLLNSIVHGSSEDMSGLPEASIHSMITSPPYNVQKEYDQDLTLEEYGELIHNVLSETYRVLVPGGRACVNIANLGRKPYLPVHSLVIDTAIRIGFLMRGEIIWDKGASASSSTAWGSWLSAGNPVLRDVHEYILVFSKQTFSRPSDGRESTIERDQFLEWTKSVWTFPAESAKRVGHPAPFPEELPRRLIELYSFKGDVILDPFCGSGSTCLAARSAGRHYVGYEIEEQYVELARSRLDESQ